jgi:hypothetical protein
MDDDFQPCFERPGVRSSGQRNGFAIAKIVCIDAPPSPGEFAMAGLFDVSKEIILVTGAIMLRASNASRYMTGSVATVDGGFLLT